MNGVTRSFLGFETTLTEYVDPARAELTVTGRGPVSMEEGSGGQRWTFEIPGTSWYAIRSHILDTDPVRAELKRAHDDALTEIKRLSDDRDRWKRAADSPFRQGLDCSPANVEALSGAVRRVERERDAAVEQAALWKSLAERQDNTAPLRTELRATERERDELKRSVEYLRLQVAETTPSDDVEELEATIVRQAREITQLKGESE